MADEISRLVADLDAEPSEAAEDARHALAALGPRAPEPLIAAAPAFRPAGAVRRAAGP
ncbi:hypothetical protein [Streptomyces sp. NPDC001348]